MIACYVRVSTKRQRTDSQRAEIERWLAGNRIGLSTVTWFEDKETGKTLCRPAFEKLQKAVFSGQVKMVVTYKLDRLSRSLRDGVNVLADWCERGVRVVSTTQGVDLSGPVGRMVAALLLGVAEIELEYRRERQAAGIRVAKKGVEGDWLELYVDESDDAVIELARKYATLEHEAKGAWRGGKMPFEHPCAKRPEPKAPR